MVEQQADTTQPPQNIVWPALPEPNLKGDAQGANISAYLNKRMNEN